jgi:glycosyltransferase involved in cell wall biosynthesis
MIIDLYTHTAELQGAPLILQRLAEAFVGNGKKCRIFSPEEGPLNELCIRAGIEFHVIPALLTGRPSALRQLHKIIGNEKPDRIYVNTIVGYKLLRSLREKFPVAHLDWMIHESQLHEYMHLFPDLSDHHFAIPDNVIFTADATKKVYEPYADNRFLTIHTGLDVTEIDALQSAHTKENIRMSLNLPQDRPVILMVGTLTGRKGQHGFVEAALRLIKSHSHMLPLFVMVGDAAPGSPYRTELERVIALNDAQEFFRIVPATAKVLEYFHAADIFVCNSLLESFPLVILEAMAFGLPIVAADTYGVREQIVNGDSGLLFFPGHTEQLADAMLSLLQNPTEAQRLGDNARGRLHELFTMDLYMKRHEELMKPRIVPQEKKSGRKPLPYAVFALAKKIWIMLGSPAESHVRRIRHDVFGGLWPVQSPFVPQRVPAALHRTNVSVHPSYPFAITKYTYHPLTVAVVIPCHNYAKYLGEAIESVLAQTRKADEIVVVDDSSSDNTAEIVARYADKGVRYVRGEWKSVGAARNAGFHNTKANLLVFLDADNMLHPDYLQCGEEALGSAPEAGIAYSDLQFFGNEQWRFKAPDPFDWFRFEMENMIDAGAMVKREALAQIGGWSHGIGQDGDWVTWRKLLELGWKPIKSRGTFFYRKHDTNMSNTLRKEKKYAEYTGLEEELITFCLPLSGRKWMWPIMQAFLVRQTYPHEKIRLILLDTSQDPEFARMVREWALRCDYPGVTYLQQAVGRKGVADMPRDEVIQEICDVCAAIYNRLAQMVTTPLALIIEDDVIPPDDAVMRLMQHLDTQVVTVSGFYVHRQRPEPVAWNWDPNGWPVDVVAQKGVTQIGGNGFGCLLIRGEYFSHSVFRSGPSLFNFDHNFYRTMTFLRGHRAVIDWDCRCKHYENAHEYF